VAPIRLAVTGTHPPPATWLTTQKVRDGTVTSASLLDESTTTTELTTPGGDAGVTNPARIEVDHSGSGLDSVVTWRLAAEGPGTRLLMEHSGFDLGSPFQQMAFRSMGPGWRSGVLEAFLAVLDDLE
jgi:hypothetical protein